MSKLQSFEEVVELAETLAVDWNIFENEKAVENDTYRLGGKRKTNADFEIERVCNNYILSAEEQDAALKIVGIDSFDFYDYEYKKAILDAYKIEIDALLDLDKYYTKAENILRGRKIEIELTDTILAHDDLLRNYFWKTKIDWGW